jgi:hypothetical protein
MLYFIITWNFLIVICLAIGVGVLNAVKADCFERKGDRFIVSVWLGLVILCSSLLATSFFLPLSSLVGVAIAILLVFFSLLSPATRTELINFRSNLSPQLIFGLLALELIVAGLTCQQIIWFDTGLYHFGSIQWLSRFGTVPGIALINGKFGFTSSWFALAAPLTPTIFGDRVGAITNGYVFLLAVLQLVITIQQIYQKNQSQISDWFLSIFSAVAIAVYIATMAKSPILISFSADVAVAFLIGITSWTILIIAKNSQPKPLGSSIQDDIFDARTIPLVLSAGTVTLKLSALPLLGIGFLFYIFGNYQFRSQRILSAIAILTMFLLPMVSYGIVTSGCPLYPSTFMCLDLPWTIPTEKTLSELQDIQFWQKLVSHEKSGISSLLFAFWTWFTASIKFQLMLGVIIVSIIGYIGAWRKLKQLKIPGQNWLISLGLLGMIFILVQSPLIRFGLGYFLIILCLAVAILFDVFCKNSKFIERAIGIVTDKTAAKRVFLVILFFGGLLSVTIAPNEAESAWLLPPHLPKADLVTEKVNNIEYVHPTNYTLRCWAAPLPCAALPIKQNITLRNPKNGIRSGFMLVK